MSDMVFILGELNVVNMVLDMVRQNMGTLRGEQSTVTMNAT